MIKINMDESQQAFLFRNDKMFKVITINGRILKHHKMNWLEEKADKVICVGCITPRKWLVISVYKNKGGKFTPTYRTTASMYTPEIIKHDSEKLAKMHCVTHPERSRTYLVANDGNVTVMNDDTNFTTAADREKYLLPHIVWYRKVFFQTFYVKTYNLVRWNMFYQDYIRIGDGFCRREMKAISFKVEKSHELNGKVMPFPEDFESVLPPLYGKK